MSWCPVHPIPIRCVVGRCAGSFLEQRFRETGLPTNHPQPLLRVKSAVLLFARSGSAALHGRPPPTPAKFYNAASATGIGTFTITPTVGVFVPQNSFAGTYSSTLTIAVISGP
jgi:hypothetical protein